jgi:DNA modification methylase/ParB-like chromosome segregation protein Spo0J
MSNYKTEPYINNTKNEINSIKEIKINTEYEKLVPSLTRQEYDLLKSSIKKSGGNIIPIIVNESNILLEGHHRYKACLELGLKPRIELQKISDSIEEKEFIIAINLNRRHLNQFQISELGYKLEEIEKQKARYRQLKNLKNIGDISSISSLASNEANEEEKAEIGKVSKIIANRIGQSSTKYERNKKIIEEGSEEQKNKIREGIESTNKIYKEIVKAKKKDEFLKNSKVLPSLGITTDTSNNNYQPFKLILGDFMEIGEKKIANESIDLIFTDPPYSSDCINIFSKLAIFANRVLKPGSSIVTYIGQHNLPEILDIFTSNNLKYWWPLAVKLTGSTKAFHRRKVFVLWKLLLWLVKGEKISSSYPIAAINDYLYDYVESKPTDKILHPWEQSTVEAEHIIKKLTLEDHIVLDPLMGSGTTGIATLNLNRKFIGIEKEDDKFKIAKARLANHVYTQKIDSINLVNNLATTHCTNKDNDSICEFNLSLKSNNKVELS